MSRSNDLPEPEIYRPADPADRLWFRRVMRTLGIVIATEFVVIFGLAFYLLAVGKLP